MFLPKFFAPLAFLLALSRPVFAGSYYVDPINGRDESGGGNDAPFRTIGRALKQVDGIGGEIHLSPDAGPFRENIVINKGGLPDNPLIIDGHGAVINLGVDITKGPWIKTGDGYVLDRTFAKAIRTGDYQMTPVFVNGLGILGDHPQGPSYAPRLWHGGYIRLDAQGRLVLVFPVGLTPENSVIVLTGNVDLNGVGGLSSGVQMSNASNVVIRNLTSAFAGNDGFGFHGNGKNVVLERVQAIFNADEGMSAHATCEVEARDSEAAFNGSQGGGVHDVNEAVTTYKNLRTHQNRAGALSLQGKRHVLDGVISYGNLGGGLPSPAANIEMRNCVNQGPADKVIPTVADPNATPDPMNPVEESDRLGRFLQVRPPWNISDFSAPWKQLHFRTTSNNGSAADDADPDGDKLTNIQEYIFGTIPTSLQASLMTISSSDSQNITLSFFGRQASGTGYTGLVRHYRVEKTRSLSNPDWQPLTGYEDIAAGNSTISITQPTSDQSKSFYRLKSWLQ